VALMTLSGAALIAAARERGEHGEGRITVVKDPVVIKECGACHMVFQAGFLPAASWTKMMGDLKNHFGDNAALDPAVAKTITDYLVANAADARTSRESPAAKGAEPPLRISELAWFKQKHGKRGRSSPENLKRHKAKSMADCKACHPGAEKGYYEDD
jgi:hypothetical protein